MCGEKTPDSLYASVGAAIAQEVERGVVSLSRKRNPGSCS